MRIDSSQNLYFVLGSSKKIPRKKNSVKRPRQAGVLDCVCVTGLKWFSVIWFSHGFLLHTISWCIALALLPALATRLLYERTTCTFLFL